MESFKKDTIAMINMLNKFVGKIKEEACFIDLGCGDGTYEYVAVEDIDYVLEDFLKEEIK